MTEKLFDFFSAGSTEKTDSMNTSCVKKHRTSCPTRKASMKYQGKKLKIIIKKPTKETTRRKNTKYQQEEIGIGFQK